MVWWPEILLLKEIKFFKRWNFLIFSYFLWVIIACPHFFLFLWVIKDSLLPSWTRISGRLSGSMRIRARIHPTHPNLWWTQIYSELRPSADTGIVNVLSASIVLLRDYWYCWSIVDIAYIYCICKCMYSWPSFCVKHMVWFFIFFQLGERVLAYCSPDSNGGAGHQCGRLPPPSHRDQVRGELHPSHSVADPGCLSGANSNSSKRGGGYKFFVLLFFVQN